MYQGIIKDFTLVFIVGVCIGIYATLTVIKILNYF